MQLHGGFLLLGLLRAAGVFSASRRFTKWGYQPTGANIRGILSHDTMSFQASQGEHFRMQQKASFPQIDWEEDLNLSIIPAPWQKQAVFVPGDLVVEQGG